MIPLRSYSRSSQTGAPSCNFDFVPYKISSQTGAKLANRGTLFVLNNCLIFIITIILILFYNNEQRQSKISDYFTHNPKDL